MRSEVTTVLTLLLVLGAVTCSPVPSNLPALPDNAHIEVTHEVRHVTYEVSEEVNEATASSHIPSDVPPEEDPPIPTVTTPHTAPEEQLPQDENVTEDHVAEISEGEVAQETLPEHEVTIGEETKSEEKKTEVTQEENEEPVSKDEDSDTEYSNENEKSSVDSSELVPESHVVLSSDNENSHKEDSAQVVEETDTTLVIPSENPESEANSDLSLTEQVNDQEHSKHEEHEAEEENIDLVEPEHTKPVEHEPVNPDDPEPTSLLESESTNPVETEHQDPVVVEPTTHMELESASQVEEEPTSQVEAEPTSQVEAEHTSQIEAEPTSQIEAEPTSQVEAEPTSQAKEDHVSHTETEITIQAEAEPTGQIEAVPTSEIEVEPATLQEEEHMNAEKLEHLNLAEDEVPHESEAESANFRDSELLGGTEREHAEVVVSNEDQLHVFNGEVFEEVPSQDSEETDVNSEFLETEKRTDDTHLLAHEDPPHKSSDETEGAVPEVETARESRVYIETRDQVHHEDTKEIPIVPEQNESHKITESKPANSGLESLSMTSPTPESLPDDLDIDDLEKDEVLSEEYPEYPEEAVIPDIPEMDSQEENSTLATNAEEPDVVPEVVINPPSSTIAPLPGDEFTDSYSDPLEESGNLPDFDVTHEQLPSKTYPHPEETQLIPEDAHDHTGELSEGDSSDLAAGDHTLEVDSGSPRVLLPQQEQISAAAPSALTPGCIVAIVFGVLISLVVILGVGGFMIWQRRTQNRPKVLGSDQGYAGSDSGGYIDDQVRVSYVNSQTDTPKGPQAQGQQVFIRLKNLKPSLPASAAGMLKSLPTMPKIAPMNMPNFNQIISKRESGGSNQPGQ